MKSTTTVITIVLVLLTAFITNPERQKHITKAAEVLSEHLELEKENALVHLATGSFMKMLLTQKVQRNNYYLFSTSHIYSAKRDKTLVFGLGIFGQVIWIASQEEVNDFLTASADGITDSQPILNQSDKELEKPSAEDIRALLRR